jgi:hypothetical protein
MTHELIGGLPAANEREQMGRILRYAFPLGLASFNELLGSFEDAKKAKSTYRWRSSGPV